MFSSRPSVKLPRMKIAAVCCVALALGATACSHKASSAARCTQATAAENGYYAGGQSAIATYSTAPSFSAARTTAYAAYDRGMRLAGQIIVDDPECFTVSDLAQAKQYLARPTPQP
jgi:hypothetical protein